MTADEFLRSLQKLPLPLCLPLLATSCGYHVSSHVDALPKRIQTIAIPAFDNLTTRYKLSDRLPLDIAREFVSRSRYRVVADPNNADAVLRGAITNYTSYPNVADGGIARSVQMSVFMQLSLVDRDTGTVLFTRPSMEVRQRYEISVDQQSYLDESDIGLERLSKDVAKTVVSAILEAF